MSAEKPPYYPLDSETRGLLEEALEWAQWCAQCQIDDDSADYATGVLLDLAYRFGLSTQDTQVELAVDEETGERVTVIRELKPRPTLRLVDSDPPSDNA